MPMSVADAVKILTPSTPVVPVAPVVPPAAAPPTTTTVATVTTTVTPASPTVSWYSSLKFRAYMGGWLTLVIGWAVENITTHSLVISTWTWIALATSTLLTVRSVVADWMSPDVVAPFSVLNKNNPS